MLLVAIDVAYEPFINMCYFPNVVVIAVPLKYHRIPSNIKNQTSKKILIRRWDYLTINGKMVRYNYSRLINTCGVLKDFKNIINHSRDTYTIF